MKGLYGRLIDNHPLANIAFLVVLLGGIVTYLTLPRAQDPEINFNWVSIITTLPGASAEDVERELTGPLEDAIKQVKDIRFVSSSSRETVSSILVRFEELSEREFDKRVNDLRREIQNKASAELPVEATDPEVLEITSSNGFPTAVLVLHGAAGETLRAQAFALKKDLEGLAGVRRGHRGRVRRSRAACGFRPGAARGRRGVADPAVGWRRRLVSQHPGWARARAGPRMAGAARRQDGGP